MTNREIWDRIEAEARRRAALAQECHRPMWLPDAELGHERTPEPSGAWRNVAWVIAAWIVLVALTGLACRAWGIEDDIAARRTRAVVAQMEGK
jgi:hypothetical protein